MGDLRNPVLIYSKGVLFFGLGVLAATLLLMEVPSFRVGLLLVLSIWGFCRFYYFAFYVIEHYVDPAYRFAGLFSFARYVIRRRPQSESVR